MKYLKSSKYWFAFFIVFYTIFGFIVIPWFVSNKAGPLIKERLGVHVEFGETKFNPYNFILSVNSVVLKDLDQKPVLGFKNIHINYDITALLFNTLLFKTIDIEAPELFIELEKDGKLNLTNILPPNPSFTEEKKGESTTAIVLHKLSITDGTIRFSDIGKDKPFNLKLGPYNFKAHDISTKEGDLNAHNFRTQIDGGGEIFWEGGMRLSPLSLHGEVQVSNLNLPKFYSYALPDFDASLKSGTLSLRLPYQIDFKKEVQTKINGADLTLNNIVFEDEAPLADISQIKLDGFYLTLPKQEIEIDNFSIKDSNIQVVLDESQNINLITAFQNRTNTDESNSTNNSKPWSFLLHNFDLSKTNINLQDKRKDFKAKLTQASLHVKSISSEKSLPIEYKFSSIFNENTKLDFIGDVTQKPFIVSSAVNIGNLQLAHFVEYIKPFVTFDIQNADINIKADIKAEFDKSINFIIKADTSIEKLLINAEDGKKLLTWEKLKLDEIKYQHKPMKIDIKDLKIDTPFIRMHINKDGSTSFSNLVKESKTTPKKEKSEPIKIRIGPMKLVNGAADFSDDSLPFPFATFIHNLHGDFSTLDFQTTTPMTINLSGEIEKYGYTNITGVLSPFNIKENASLDLLFKNINLNSLTPYSGKFIGYKIESGKLSMDLKYNIKDAKLIGDNKINIDTLTLGEKVDSPDAPNLPLEFAIALLKDSEGQIGIDLPVAGDINNPEFSYGSIIWGAVGNMITGIVTSPFRFLGSMLGIDGDSLKSIDFDKGSYEVISTEHEKLENLTKILSKRPALKLNIAGGYDDNFDVYELQKQRFKSIINKELSKPSKEKEDVYGYALKNIYVKNFSLEKYEKSKESFTVKGKIDTVLFNKKVQKDITTNIKIEKEALKNLANARAKSIKIALSKSYNIDEKRLNILPPKPTKAKRGRWVESKLSISI